MASVQFHQVSYGLTQPLINIFPAPIVGLRNPATTDHAQIGTLWINRSTNGAFIITSIVNNSATWTNLISGGGSFSSLTVTPGPTSLTGAFTVISGTNPISIGADAASHTITIGNNTGTTLLDLNGGSSGIIMETSATGPITIGGTGMTANIQIGNSVSGQVVNIAGSAATGTQMVSIASGDTSGSNTVEILAGDATGGSLNLNVMNGTTVIPGTMNLGFGGTGAVQVNIGNVNGASTTFIRGGTGGVAIAAPFVRYNIINIYTGSGAPAGALALEAGDLYINTSPTGATDRMFIATGVGAWTNFTTAA